MGKLTEEELRILDAIMTVPVRFVDNPNGGIMDELPVYIQPHHAENFARAIAAALRDRLTAAGPTAPSDTPLSANEMDAIKRIDDPPAAVDARFDELGYRIDPIPTAQGDEVAEIESLWKAAEDGRGQKGWSQMFWPMSAHKAIETLLRILKSRPAPVLVDREAFVSWLCANINPDEGFYAMADALISAFPGILHPMPTEAALVGERERIAAHFLDRHRRYADPQSQIKASYDDADALLSSGAVARVPTQSWQNMDTAPKDGNEIIYLNREPKNPSHPWWAGSAHWRDADEGVQEGWYDDAMTDYVDPVGWMPFPAATDAILALIGGRG